MTTACLGAHMSIAGGLHRAVERATDAGCATLQIFSKNNNRWAARPLDDAAITAWREALQQSELRHPIAHASYLINLAAPDEALWAKSTEALADELRRAQALRLEGLVVHPGAFTTSSAEAGIERIAEAVRRVLAQVPAGTTRLLLENTAGQGSCLGHRFEQLGAMLAGIDAADRVGVCFDTCHAFAAGYDLRSPDGFREMVSAIRDALPAGVIRALHLNDSKKPCGSRVDRHEHIGRGEIGLDGFRHVLGHDGFRELPMYLETPKGTDEESGEDWDRINLGVLRAL